MLSREAVAAALALAGVRSGAHVLDLAPDAGLTAAARAAAGVSGRVDAASDQPLPGTYGHALAVWPNDTPEQVVESAESARSQLAPQARVTVGSSGSLADLVDRLRLRGWTVLHGTTVVNASTSRASRADLALAVARAPRQ
jgi:hypothetical protein